jgi:hypothetical protein
MHLAAVKVGDIVRVDKKGRVFLAFVIAKSPGELKLEPIQRGVTYTSASAREVVCHWAKRGRPRGKPARSGASSP